MRSAERSIGTRGQRLLASIAVGLATASAFAEQPQNITRGELALLPDYCPKTQTFTTDDPRSRFVDSPAKSLYLELGSSYLALHHYCWGLLNVRRAQLQPSSQTRRWYIETAINDYKYVLANSTADFALRPEIFLRLGEAHTELQAYASALDAFYRSREAKFDYWPAYERAAAVLVRLNKNADAQALLEEGMVRMPSERALIDAYKRAGGNHTRFLQTPAASAAAASAAASAASPP